MNHLKSHLLGLPLLMALLAAPLFAQDDAEYRKVESKLDAAVIDSLILEDTDIKEAVKYIAKKAGVTILFDRTALDGMDADDRELTLELTEIKASNALNLVLAEVGLVKGFKHGFLYVMAEANVEAEIKTATYDVRDITLRIKDFQGPKLRLTGDIDERTDLDNFLDELDETRLDSEDIEELVEDSVDADWGDAASLKVVKGQLVVRATREVQKEVAALLDQLRAGR